MTASLSLARRLLETLARETADPPGVTRASYGAGEQRAHDLMAAEAKALGCEAATDAAGNLYMTFPGADRSAPRLLVGSHLDSVPHGGNFDGAAGVVAGLALIADLRARGVTPPRDITVVAFRAEEAAWFPISYPGSLAALGQLGAAALEVERSDTGRTLFDHMREAGCDPQAVARGVAFLDSHRIAAFVEVHIEQGPALVAEGLPIGLVTAISGGFRHMEGRITGAWAHSGGTPRRYRADVVLGLADLAAMLEEAWDRIEASGREATITIGQVATDPAMHGGSRVAGALAFTMDIRSQHAEVLDGLRADLPRFAAAIGAERGVEIDFGPEMDWPIAAMSGPLLDDLEAAAGRAGVPCRRMPSGAGHDAAVLAGAGVPTAMIFVRNANGSHNPDEAMEVEDLDRAVAVLSEYVRGQ